MSTLISRYRSARRGGEPGGTVVLEGLHALKHALRFGAEVMEARSSDPDAVVDLARRLAPDLAEALPALLTPTDPAVFRALTPSAPAAPVVALARRPAVDARAVLADPGGAPVVLLERPTHHGNIGAVVRVAAAAEAGGVLVTGPHDPWHAAAIRGGAGLQFALPVSGFPGEGGADAVLDAARAGARPVVALDADGSPLGATTLPPRALLVFGSERAGVSPKLLARADVRLAIPMRAGVSSLNLATAVAVTLYCGGRGIA